MYILLNNTDFFIIFRSMVAFADKMSAEDRFKTAIRRGQKFPPDGGGHFPGTKSERMRVDQLLVRPHAFRFCARKMVSFFAPGSGQKLVLLRVSGGWVICMPGGDFFGSIDF